MDQLRFKKKQKASAISQGSSTPLSTLSVSSSESRSLVSMPAQSRDATTSIFFAPPPKPNGTILVPSSSPLSAPSTIRQNDSSHHNELVHSLTYESAGHVSGPDPLSVSSGFTNGNIRSDASSATSVAGFVRPRVDDDASDAPPRKRTRPPLSDDSLDRFNIPDSPVTQKSSQRRAPVVARIANVSTSSDESVLNTSTNSTRIVRGVRPQDHSAVEVIDDGPGFLPFRISFPQFEEGKVRAAWRQAGCDVRAATALLLDPSFSYQPTLTPGPKAPSPAVSPSTGRVKELEDARHAERAAAKEKGKKSMIYAARTNLAPPSSTPPPPARPPITSDVILQQSPASPIVALRRFNRPKRIAESDEEEDLRKSESDKGSSHSGRRAEETSSDERRTLAYFNTTRADGLQELTGCTPDQAQTIIELRPFDSVDDLREKLGQQGKKKGATSKGVSSRMFDDCVEIFRGYGAVDDVLAQCERIGGQLSAAIASWSQDTRKGKEKATCDNIDENGALSLVSPVNERTSKDFLSEQPKSLSRGVQLKGYQLLGVNWLRLLYKRGRSCILADEMGLGKTVQVISFFAHLKDSGKRGPHLVVVPSSTLENWVREFARFAPTIAVQTYYGSKDDRPFLRQTLLETLRSRSTAWEVLITTYNLATGDDKDRKFLRKIEWDTCVFDEGHVLKNFESQRYQALMRNKFGWRLLLTGTPLQNNLQELVSLMNFILPDLLEDSLESLRAVFKAKGDSKVTLLAQERVSRAKKMMTPFVLRRRKDQVLKDLPKKMERIEWCEMTPQQRAIYNDALNRSRKTIFDLEPSETSTPGTETPPVNGRPKPSKKSKTPRTKDKLYLENSSNVLMDLRKAASHPMLFRTQYTDKTLDAVTRVLLKEADFKRRGAVAKFVKEDMEVMTDAELQVFLRSYVSTQKFLEDEKCYLQAGKVQALLRLLKDYQAEGRRMLIFSQFTQILDILQAVFKMQKVKYLLLTGATAVDVRQSLVDEFNENESIPCFLLSTKAGGMGINLTAASVVILFDQDFNPHNDKQAQDRAYRIGQKRDVDVVKLITRNSIEEDMLRLGQTKLALDEAVAGDSGEQAGEDFERKIKTSLMSTLRKQLANTEAGDGEA